MSGTLLPAGSTVGIIGGGQLARMLAMAAARLGYRTLVLDPDANCPAAQAASGTIVADFADKAGLAELFRRADVVTYEFENVPVEPVRAAAAGAPLFPPAEALEVAQDRVVEKAFLNGIGIATAEWRAIDRVEEIGHALIDLDGDCILKTRRLGYDGKGQATIRREGPYTGAFESLGEVPSILEKKVPFTFECSVVAARAVNGDVRCFDPAENTHGMGILRRSVVPGRVSAEVARRAFATTHTILDRLAYVGIIGVEFFVTAEGELLVNEIAPRVHNSGHWTEAACTVSQFEQHIRAVVGAPLGDPARHSDCTMENLIGQDISRVAELLGEPGILLHLYGKAHARPGRKMGHFTRLARGG